MEDTHKWIGNHPQEINVGDKTVMLAPGDPVALSDDDAALEVTKDMIDSGTLMVLPRSGKKGGDD